MTYMFLPVCIRPEGEELSVDVADVTEVADKPEKCKNWF